MKALTKLAKPKVLMEHEAQWTTEFCGSTAAKQPERYKNRAIRKQLGRETRERCAYCESSMDGVAWTHIEHILPKAKRPDLVVEWTNLTLACPQCNVAKEDYYEPTQPLLNPYVDNPREHLMFFGSIVRNRPGDLLGKRTVRRLKLQRAELARARDDRLAAVFELADQWAALNGADKDLFAEGIRMDLDNGDFSECVRAVLQELKFPM